MTDQDRKTLQTLMEDPRWEAVDRYYQHFMLQNFAIVSIKRNDQFNTLWEAAASEGGKDFVQRFYQGFENEAKKV